MEDPVSARITRIGTVLASVPDPEIPAVSITELGIVRDIGHDRSGQDVVVITPTYTGCPATEAIALSIRVALDVAGFADVAISNRLSPPWTTDWITDEGRRKLLAYGIAPPERGAALHADNPARCPRCLSLETEEISRFGSTPCKAQWRCLVCLEPFDRFKCH